jgi:4-hydroxy-L-threonine phosphate dehydrogenase PdxA
MVLYTDKLKVIHVSTHIALRKFLDTLNGQRVETVIGIADRFLNASVRVRHCGRCRRQSPCGRKRSVWR